MSGVWYREGTCFIDTAFLDKIRGEKLGSRYSDKRYHYFQNGGTTAVATDISEVRGHGLAGILFVLGMGCRACALNPACRNGVISSARWPIGALTGSELHYQIRDYFGSGGAGGEGGGGLGSSGGGPWWNRESTGRKLQFKP